MHGGTLSQQWQRLSGARSSGLSPAVVPLHLSATDAGWLKDFGDNLTFVGNSSSICVGTNGSDGNDTSFIACYFTSPFSSISMRRIPTGSPLLWCVAGGPTAFS